MEREVRYCTTSDGVRIAYYVEGEGPPFVWCPTFIESYSLVHLAPKVERTWSSFVPGRKVVRFDHRGTGLSQRDVIDLSLDGLEKDLRAVVDAAQLAEFSLGGTFNSAPYCLAYAAAHPKRVKRLVILNGYARVSDAFNRDVLQGLANFSRGSWEIATRAMANSGPTKPDVEYEQEIARWLKESATGDVAARRIESNLNVDVAHVLQKIQASTLIIQLADTPNRANAQSLALDISDVRVVTLTGGGWDAVKPMYDAIDAFLDEDPETRRLPVDLPPPKTDANTFRTVLFTDLVGHTEMMSRLGDDAGRAVLREHERITREVLKVHGGTEVKTMGDGFMASFGSVTRAVECAIALQRAIDERNRDVGAQQLAESPTHSGDLARVAAPLQVRIGLNAGEPIEEDGDLFGATVILASRIAARADAGEILVADTVRGLCSGKGFLFADRGEFAAKGFEEPVRVYEVSWRP